MSPRISVIVPNYNHAAFLEQRIQSILRQTNGDYEVILLDDGSSDRSLEILNRYAQQPRFRLLTSERNSGNPYKQWNKGVAAARGDLVWIAESDDYACEIFLERLVDQLDRHPSAGLAYSQSWIVDLNGERLHLNDAWTRDLGQGRWQQDFFAAGRDECRNFLIFKNTIPNVSAVLFRKELFERIGGVDETFFYAGDWHTWARMLAGSDLCFCHEALNHYRTHSGTVRIKEWGGTRRVLENYRVLEWLLQHIDVMPANAEKALELAMERWQSMLTFRAVNRAAGKNRPIIQVARRIDRRLWRRFVRHFWARIRRKMHAFLESA